MTGFWIGFLCGIAVMLPAVFWISRRIRQRASQIDHRARANERLAELGMLTGGLAHEIKNPLSTVGLNLQLLEETLQETALPEPAASRMRSRIQALSQETKRLKGILEDFLSFAGRIRISARSTRINDIITELVDFYLPQASSSGIQLRTQLDPAAGEVHLDVTLFKQALLNLLINATQAMVQTRYDGLPNGGAADLILRTSPAKDGVDVHVIDTGPGMDAETLSRIFQPYFTTKRGGTGLGLPTTQRILNEHGGTIDVHSEPGKGSDFTIFLPRKSPATEGSRQPA